MAAPEFVPTSVTQQVRSYSSPPSRSAAPQGVRPGSIGPEGQPSGTQLGSQGPDQGYVFKLARQFEGKLHLADGEHEADAIAGCRAVALKRASLFGRAPVIHDVRIALTIWGFLDEDPPAELVALRRSVFEAVESDHHYSERRVIVDSVADAVLSRSPEQVASTYQKAWSDQIDVGVFD